MKRLISLVAVVLGYAALATSPIRLLPETGYHDAGTLFYNQGAGLQVGAVTFDGINANRVLFRTPTACGLQVGITVQNDFGQIIGSNPTRPAWNQNGYSYFEYDLQGYGTRASITMNASVFVPGYANCGVRTFVRALYAPIPTPGPYPVYPPPAM